MDPGGPVPPPGEERERVRAETEANTLRGELARHLERTAFPADRRTVLDGLEAHHAPEPVPEAARRLPDGRRPVHRRDRDRRRAPFRPHRVSPADTCRERSCRPPE
ncbi:DUF2795 domain-containing protein [Streptomyces sp. NPDC058335]|uniref:DUF2795 domain-containing protein n=1 Tax=Streptomyces sp. NPDC058335 TaxID=3346451 RepID=UPI00365DE92A